MVRIELRSNFNMNRSQKLICNNGTGNGERVGSEIGSARQHRSIQNVVLHKLNIWTLHLSDRS